jgi:dihydrofolate reductase
MRRLRYNVAVSVDGFIAPPDGSADWIVHDETIDFEQLYGEFGTFILGRKTWEYMVGLGDQNPLIGRPRDTVVVVSSQMKSVDWPGVTIIEAGAAVKHIAALKAGEGRDIWLFGGGQLAGLCFRAGLVDTVETAIMPVLLAGGAKLIEMTSEAVSPHGFRLGLVSTQRLEKSGILMCKYEVLRDKLES